MARGGWSKRQAEARLSKNVLRGHYEWCLKEGRDTTWYKEEIHAIDKKRKKNNE